MSHTLALQATQLPVPVALLLACCRCSEALALLCRVPSVANGATNLLHHWQQQEPSLWPSAPRKQPGPSPFVAPAANSHTQKYREQPAAQPGRGQPAAHGVCRTPCMSPGTAVLHEETPGLLDFVSASPIYKLR